MWKVHLATQSYPRAP